MLGETLNCTRHWKKNVNNFGKIKLLVFEFLALDQLGAFLADRLGLGDPLFTNLEID